MYVSVVGIAYITVRMILKYLNVDFVILEQPMLSLLGRERGRWRWHSGCGGDGRPMLGTTPSRATAVV